jgi:hypothetical protein
MLRANKPSWENAPDWANFVAMDSDGIWWWYGGRPEKLKDIWQASSINEMAEPIDGILGGADWEESLEERPSDD